MSKKQTSHILKGSAKKVIFSNGGELIDISLQPAVLMKAMKWMNDQRSEAGLEQSDWIRIRVKERRDADAYGNTHYVELNTWLPESKTESSAKAKPDKKSDPEDDGDGLPF